MTPREAAFLIVGALSFPLGLHLGARIAGRHFLSITLKEQS